MWDFPRFFVAPARLAENTVPHIFRIGQHDGDEIRL